MEASGQLYYASWQVRDFSTERSGREEGLYGSREEGWEQKRGTHHQFTGLGYVSLHDWIEKYTNVPRLHTVGKSGSHPLEDTDIY